MVRLKSRLYLAENRLIRKNKTVSSKCRRHLVKFNIYLSLKRKLGKLGENILNLIKLQNYEAFPLN